MRKDYSPVNAAIVADAWSRDWCGECAWTAAMRQFGQLGGKSVWWGGYPRSASAIPLCFTLILPNGEDFPSSSRLKDIRAAIAKAKGE